jgi:hypothetical protein
MMRCRPCSVDCGLQLESISSATAEIPLKLFLPSRDFAKLAEYVPFSVVPQHCFPKNQAEWHLVDQRFQRAGWSVGSQKISVRPAPKVAMPVSTIVSLNSEAQWIHFAAAAIESDLPGKQRIGMRRS